MILESDIHNATILIVDDIEDNVFILERTLSEAGYSSIISTTD